MKTAVITSIFGLFGIISSALAADDTFVVNTEVIKQASLDKLHQQGLNTFEMFDIDNNGKISQSELKASTNGLENVPFYTSGDIEHVKQEISKALDKFDTDKDGYLDRTEAVEFISYVENILTNMQIAKIDADNNGEITDEEMMAFSKTLPSIEESLAKLQEATDRLKEINKNPEQHFNNMLSNMNTNVNQEEYTQMDKNKDDKVTQEEFINYQFNHPNNKELEFTIKDYNEIFVLIDTSNKGYITQKEYLEYNQKQMDNVLKETPSEEEK